jgi:hypothetical protein
MVIQRFVLTLHFVYSLLKFLMQHRLPQFPITIGGSLSLPSALHTTSIIYHRGHVLQFLAIVGNFSSLSQLLDQHSCSHLTVLQTICLLLNLSIHPLEAKKFGEKQCASSSFSLRWVPSMVALLSRAFLKYAARADSSFSSGKSFSHFHYLKNGQWRM